MKKLDRYIIRKYLGTFFFTCLLFSMVALVIDFSERVQKFVDKKIPLEEIVGDYYINFIPWINSLLWPLFSLIAVIYFTSRLARNTEIISMYSSGISFGRVLRPYLIAGSLLMVLSILGNHYVIPRANDIRLRFERQYIWTSHDQGKYENVHVFLSPDSKAFVRFYRKRDSTISDLRLETYNEEKELVSVLKASSAEWLAPPHLWRLKNYEKRTFDSLSEAYFEMRGRHLDTSIAITPQDFSDYRHGETTMTTPEIQRFIAREKRRGLRQSEKHIVEIYRRTAEPIAILLLTIIGYAVASRKVRGGIGLHLAVGMGIGAMFVFISKFSIQFAHNPSLHPLLGAWLPNLLFLPVTIYLVIRAQK
jgi:lipopolysaccharide export system permease protein